MRSMLMAQNSDPRRRPQEPSGKTVAVVIPCYCVARHLIALIPRIGEEVDVIFCVDDACPERSTDGLWQLNDKRVRIIQRRENGGVGAAVCDGYRAAIAAGVDIIVKMDGDGQMDPAFIISLTGPIARGEADYVKGNRFFDVDTLGSMGWTRIAGNAGLSFLTKLSTGYWNLFDPTNGFTAVDARIARLLPLEKLHNRFFFETDMLFRLGILRAKVIDIPLAAIYRDERSNLSEIESLLVFPLLHFRNLVKRVAYNYFLRGFSLASLHLVLGLCLCAASTGFGLLQWARSLDTGIPATPGTVMVAALPIILGSHLLISFISHDMASFPSLALHPRMRQTELLRRSADRAPED